MADRRSLLITRNFPPLVGGMERLNEQLLLALQQRGPSALVGPPGAAAYGARACVRETRSSKLAGFLPEAAVHAFVQAREHRPDLVMGGSGVTAPHAVLAARACSARAAVYVHGLDLVTRHRLYRAAWLRAIRACDIVLTNSRNTQALAVEAGVRSERIRIVHPGTFVPHDVPRRGGEFRDRFGLPAEAPILLSVGRLTSRKGMPRFVDNVFPHVVRAYPGAVLVLIGDEAGDALQRGDEAGFAPVRSAADKHGLAENIRWLGRQSDEVLHAAFAAADVHVFPVLDLPGDVEGFGMVAIEAAAHGLPTVAYAAGGVGDAVSEGSSGRLIPAGDSVAFAEAVLSIIGQGREAWFDAARRFAERFSWAHFPARLAEALDGSR